jgi:HD-like signal output (HDOD) protein
MAVADCARQLAIYTGISQDIAFTAGLLHDIGLLVIVLLFPDDFSRIIKEPHPNSIETERRIMGFDHVEIGSKAAKHWNFPVAIQEAIEQHETPPTQESALSLGLLIYTANLLVTEAEPDDESGFERQKAIAQVLDKLDIPIDQATQWADASRQFANQIVAII